MLKAEFIRNLESSLDKIDCVKFAVWCVKKIIPIWERECHEDDVKTMRLVVKYVKTWIDNPTYANSEIVRSARHSFSLMAILKTRHNDIANAAAEAAIKAADAAIYTAVIDSHLWRMTAGLSVYWTAIHTLTALGRHDRSSKDLFDEYMRSFVELNTISLCDLNKGL